MPHAERVSDVILTVIAVRQRHIECTGRVKTHSTSTVPAALQSDQRQVREGSVPIGS